ncbi:MAG: tetratricopeptide repeat protein [Bacteroidetes bacterium]|nr:tetratricopeptide repeat protein [Bacteroidota bacterium]
MSLEGKRCLSPTLVLLFSRSFALWLFKFCYRYRFCYSYSFRYSYRFPSRFPHMCRTKYSATVYRNYLWQIVALNEPMSIKKGLVLLLFAISGKALYAQKTEVYQQPEELFYHAVELFEKKLYGPSIQEFERYMKLDKSDNLLRPQAEIYVLINHLHLNHNNSDKNLEKRLEQGPQTGINNMAHFELGNYYFRTGNYRKAAKAFEDVDVSNLSNDLWEEANFKMGYSFFKSKDYEKAQEHLNQVRNKSKSTYYIEANYFYGYICYVQNKYDCAFESFKRIENDGPQIMYLYMAQMLYAKNDFKGALDYLTKHQLEKYPEEFNLLTGKCHFQLGDYAKATTAFKGISLESELLTNEDIYMIGHTFFLQKNHLKAQEAFMRISGLETPLGQLANYELAQSFIATDEKQKALLALGTAKRLEFQKEIQEIAHYNFAKLSYELGNKSQAIQVTQEFIDKYPKSEYVDDTKGMLADMLVNAKNLPQAIRVLDEIKTFNESTKKVYQRITYAWAEERFTDNSFKEARDYFNKSVRFTPDRLKEAQAYFWLGELDFKDEDYNHAITNYNRMLNNGAATSSRYYNTTLYNIGYCYYLLKDRSRALNYFLQYKQKASYNQNKTVYADNLLRLGDCYFLSSQYEKAREAYHQVSAGRYEGSDYALYQEGIIYGLQRKPGDKISALKQIQTNYKSSDYLVTAIYQIAETYNQDLQNPDMALSMFNLIISQHETDKLAPYAYVKIGLIYSQKNENEKALNYCKTVVEKYPKTESSKEALIIIESIYKKMDKVPEFLEYVSTLETGDYRVTYQDSLLYDAGYQKYRLGKCDEAEKNFNDYKKRFAQGFFIINTYYYTGLCAFYDEKYDKAIENFEYVHNQGATDFREDVNLKLAEIYYYQSRFDKALPYFSQLERIASSKDNFVKALMGQMRCNYTLGNLDAAKQNATAILPIENIELEKLIETNLILGKIQYQTNNILTAMFHFDYVVKESKTERGAEAQYYRCMILYKQQKYNESREEIFKLGDQWASYEYWVVKGFIVLADIYTAEKDYFQARATLQGVLDAYHGDQSIINEANDKLKKLSELEKNQKKK